MAKQKLSDGKVKELSPEEVADKIVRALGKGKYDREDIVLCLITVLKIELAEKDEFTKIIKALLYNIAVSPLKLREAENGNDLLILESIFIK